MLTTTKSKINRIEEALKEFRNRYVQKNTDDWNRLKAVREQEPLEFLEDQFYAIATKSAEKYNELIMAVGNKHDVETRHETALRYIKQAEQSSEAASESLSQEVIGNIHDNPELTKNTNGNTSK